MFGPPVRYKMGSQGKNNSQIMWLNHEFFEPHLRREIEKYNKDSFLKMCLLQEMRRNPRLTQESAFEELTALKNIYSDFWSQTYPELPDDSK